MPVLLIIEDDADSNEATADVLAEEGYSCLCAFDGERGLELLTEHEPTLVLLDLQLPGISGGEFLVRKAAMPAVAHIPVVVITGLSPVPKIHNVIAILRKPFTTDELLAIVGKLAPMPEPEAA